MANERDREDEERDEKSRRSDLDTVPYDEAATVPESDPFDRLASDERAMLRDEDGDEGGAHDDGSHDDDDDDGGHDHPHGDHTDEEPVEKRPALFLAEFETPGEILHAAERVRDAGYENWDVHTPFPVHGMDKAMGLGDSKLAWIVLVMGITGCVGAALMMQWMNGYDYPIIIGGKPGDAIPSMIPIMFECTILLSGIGAVFGMFGLNQLPRHHHPVFYSKRFERCTDDKFFISIEAQDPKFDLGRTRKLLESLHPSHLELVEEEVP